MYRPGSGTVKQTRYQGMGNRAPDPHDIISMHSGSEEAIRQAQFAHIQALLKDAIRDEQDAIDKYAYILEELQTVSIRQPKIRACLPPPHDFIKDKEIIEHIKSQEAAHKALLERLLKRR